MREDSTTPLLSSDVAAVPHIKYVPARGVAKPCVTSTETIRNIKPYTLSSVALFCDKRKVKVRLWDAGEKEMLFRIEQFGIGLKRQRKGKKLMFLSNKDFKSVNIQNFAILFTAPSATAMFMN